MKLRCNKNSILLGISNIGIQIITTHGISILNLHAPTIKNIAIKKYATIIPLKNESFKEYPKQK